MKSKQLVFMVTVIVAIMLVSATAVLVYVLRNYDIIITKEVVDEIENEDGEKIHGEVSCVNAIGTYTVSPIPDGSIRFAIIGDYGVNEESESNVSEMIEDWGVQFIATVGDNNYPEGSADTIDDNIGKFYHEYIGNYRGEYGEGAETNNFYPVLGNHDWRTEGALPYLDYFTLPGNERYYDFVRGSIHFLMLSSDRHDPDGFDAESVQAQWFYDTVATSTTPFRLVFMHHPPYSSSPDSQIPELRWGFEDYQIDVAFAGHEHSYERFTEDGVEHVIVGTAGADLYPFYGEARSDSLIRDNCSFGATLVEANDSEMTVRYITLHNIILDEFTIYATDGTEN